MCARFHPVWVQVATRTRGNVDFKDYDANDDSALPIRRKYNVLAAPRLVFTDNNGKLLRQTSAMPEDEFRATINEFVK